MSQDSGHIRLKTSKERLVAYYPIDLIAGAEATTGGAGDTKLEDMINELHTAMTGVKHEQEYMMIRDRIHRSISESTNSRVVIWAIFENMVIFAMTLGQVRLQT